MSDFAEGDAMRSPVVEAKQPRPVTVLAVEDEPLNRELLHAVLRREGFAVIDAASIAEARVRLAESPPDLVLLDLRLPDGDGLELCRELKEGSGIAGIPVVVATANALPAIREAADAAGCDGFLAKPFGAADVVAEVRCHVRLTRESR